MVEYSLNKTKQFQTLDPWPLSFICSAASNLPPFDYSFESISHSSSLVMQPDISHEIVDGCGTDITGSRYLSHPPEITFTAV